MVEQESDRANVVFATEDGSVAGRRHINPDGSLGGWVPITMTVPQDVYIHPSAFVLPDAKLEKGREVLPGEVVD